MSAVSYMPCQQSKVNTLLFGGRNQKNSSSSALKWIVYLYSRSLIIPRVLTNRINFVQNNTTVNSYSLKETKKNKNNTNNKVGVNLTLRLTF